MPQRGGKHPEVEAALSDAFVPRRTSEGREREAERKGREKNGAGV